MKNSDNKLLHSKQDIINDKLATESIITQEKNVFKIRETPKVKYFDIKSKISRLYSYRWIQLI